MDVKQINILEEFMKENFESSDFDAFLLDKSGNIIVSKLREEGEEIGENAVTLLENCNCISGCFSQGEVEDFLLHGKGGYIIAVNIRSMILAVSGVQESKIEETLKRVKTIAKLIEDKGVVT
ncbi:MAG: hypothetical protein ACETWM_13030 [Candidatus Lokiarchaeia archaeon]